MLREPLENNSIRSDTRRKKNLQYMCKQAHSMNRGCFRRTKESIRVYSGLYFGHLSCILVSPGTQMLLTVYSLQSAPAPAHEDKPFQLSWSDSPLGYLAACSVILYS